MLCAGGGGGYGSDGGWRDCGGGGNSGGSSGFGFSGSGGSKWGELQAYMHEAFLIIWI